MLKGGLMKVRIVYKRNGVGPYTVSFNNQLEVYRFLSNNNVHVVSINVDKE